jgi:hypothetical protein
VGNPDEIRILATIPGLSILDETRLHDRFRHLWIRGEWYRPDPELLSYIAEVGTPWSDQKTEAQGVPNGGTVAA